MHMGVGREEGPLDKLGESGGSGYRPHPNIAQHQRSQSL